MKEVLTTKSSVTLADGLDLVQVSTSENLHKVFVVVDHYSVTCPQRIFFVLESKFSMYKCICMYMYAGE